MPQPDYLVTNKARSPRWHEVEEAHLKKEGWCRHCGGTYRLQVHHVTPFHLDQTKELDPANLITLCEAPARDCHLKIGHLGDWKNFNPDVRKEAIALEPPPPPAPVEFTVNGCARCGEDHGRLMFHRMKQPCGGMEFWAICPLLGEPILGKVTGEES